MLDPVAESDRGRTRDGDGDFDPEFSGPQRYQRGQDTPDLFAYADRRGQVRNADLESIVGGPLPKALDYARKRPFDLVQC